MGRPAELVGDLTQAAHGRVGQVEGHTVETLAMADRIQGSRHEVDRHDVDLAAFEADQRHPRRDRVAQSLDEFEGVIGTIYAVGLPGLRRADHQAGAVDPKARRRLADNLFGVVLGSVVGMVQDLPLGEHLLAELALPATAGHRDRAHVVDARSDSFRQLDKVARSVDVRMLVVFL